MPGVPASTPDPAARLADWLRAAAFRHQALFRIEGGRDPVPLGEIMAFDSERRALALRPHGRDEPAIEPGESALLALRVRGRPISFSATAGPIRSGWQWMEVAPHPQALDRRELRRASDSRARAHTLVAPDAAAPERACIIDAGPDSLRVLFGAEDGRVRAPFDRIRFLDGPSAGKWLTVDARGPRGMRAVAAAEAACGRIRADGARLDERARPVDSDVSLAHAPVPMRRGSEAGSAPAAPVGHAVAWIETPSGGELAALLNWAVEPFAGPIVVVPPAWNETKESHVLLALTLVESFRQRGEPLTVIRFDGIEKPGQSRGAPGRLGREGGPSTYTFSQGAYDLEVVVAWARRRHRQPDAPVALVTFSGGSIEARRFLATSKDADAVRLWVSIVGALDVRSAAKGLSGGVDLIAMAERGETIGPLDLMGMTVDTDRLGDDALRGRMAELDDVAREFERIRAPIVWYHGAYDAWTHVGLAEVALAHARRAPASIRVLPTGHRLRSSALAGRVFRSIAGEIAEHALGRTIEGRAPARAELVAERRREMRAARESRDASSPTAERGTGRGFWKRYMLGDDSAAGYRLLTAVDDYRAFMQHQLDLLDVGPRQTVADLGCGTGAFATALARRGLPSRLIQVDHVVGAVREAGREIDRGKCPVLRVCASLGTGAAIPLGAACVDRVMLSLVVSYVDDPGRLLDEIHRILRPGGRLVVSTLVPDADTSRLYAHGRLYLGAHQDPAAAESPDALDSTVARGARSLLSGAESILEEERRGRFVFRTGEELAALLREHGFAPASSAMDLGHPAQAVIVAADRVEVAAARARRLRRESGAVEQGRRDSVRVLQEGWKRLAGGRFP